MTVIDIKTIAHAVIPVGDQGYTGSLGYTGSQGSIGYTGSLGYTGSQGSIGYTGSQGAIGYTGSAISAAGTLTGTTLASNVVTSSLTSVGTLSNLNTTGAVGIGTSSPTYTLETQGTVRIGGAALAPVAFSATGGTITTSGLYTIHTFLSSDTFTVTGSGPIDYLVVGGGGSGGVQASSNNRGGGGGGAGGMRSTVTGTGGGGSLESALSVTARAYTITVGAGGAARGSPNGTAGLPGGNSSITASGTSISSSGGGLGGSDASPGGSGGSGGGGGSNDYDRSGGSGTSGQGYAGGTGSNVGGARGAGGGGAGGVGDNFIIGGGTVSGGVGVANSISGTSVTYAAGGRGGNASGNADGGANTGNGSGGGDGTTNAGGSGIVIIRYLTNQSTDSNTLHTITTNAAGNVGIGTASPTANFQVVQRTTGAGTVSTAANSTTLSGVGTQFTNTFKAGDTLTVNGETERTISSITSDTVLIVTVAFSSTARSGVTYTLNGGTRFEVLGNGNVGIGTSGSASNALTIVGKASTSIPLVKYTHTAVDASNIFVSFNRSDATSIGSITQSGTSGLAFNTSSDARIKENITATTFGLADLMKINVSEFSYITDPNHQRITGFIAQNLKDVYPDSVTTNGDNGTDALLQNASPWMVEYGKITPLVTKAIQELNLNLEAVANIAAISHPASEAFATSFFTNVFAKINTWFADTGNGIGDFFARRVRTKELCIRDSSGAETCITKDQLDALLDILNK